MCDEIKKGSHLVSGPLASHTPGGVLSYPPRQTWEDERILPLFFLPRQSGRFSPYASVVFSCHARLGVHRDRPGTMGFAFTGAELERTTRRRGGLIPLNVRGAPERLCALPESQLRPEATSQTHIFRGLGFSSPRSGPREATFSLKRCCLQ